VTVTAYLHGAVRSRSFAGLLHRFREMGASPHGAPESGPSAEDTPSRGSGHVGAQGRRVGAQGRRVGAQGQRSRAARPGAPTRLRPQRSLLACRMLYRLFTRRGLVAHRTLRTKEVSMNISKCLWMATLVTLVAAGCIDSGGNCDACETDSDCDPDKTCSDFDGGERLCADADTWMCTTTTYY
jgi:hypothetical protein